MADPVGFEGANSVFRAPENVKNCSDLECFITEESEIV